MTKQPGESNEEYFARIDREDQDEQARLIKEAQDAARAAYKKQAPQVPPSVSPTALEPAAQAPVVPPTPAEPTPQEAADAARSAMRRATDKLRGEQGNTQSPATDAPPAPAYGATPPPAASTDIPPLNLQREPTDTAVIMPTPQPAASSRASPVDADLARIRAHGSKAPTPLDELILQPEGPSAAPAPAAQDSGEAIDRRIAETRDLVERLERITPVLGALSSVQDDPAAPAQSYSPAVPTFNRSDATPVQPAVLPDIEFPPATVEPTPVLPVVPANAAPLPDFDAPAAAQTAAPAAPTQSTPNTPTEGTMTQPQPANQPDPTNAAPAAAPAPTVAPAPAPTPAPVAAPAPVPVATPVVAPTPAPMPAPQPAPVANPTPAPVDPVQAAMMARLAQQDARAAEAAAGAPAPVATPAPAAGPAPGPVNPVNPAPPVAAPPAGNAPAGNPPVLPPAGAPPVVPPAGNPPNPAPQPAPNQPPRGMPLGLKLFVGASALALGSFIGYMAYTDSKKQQSADVAPVTSYANLDSALAAVTSARNSYADSLVVISRIQNSTKTLSLTDRIGAVYQASIAVPTTMTDARYGKTVTQDGIAAVQTGALGDLDQNVIDLFNSMKGKNADEVMREVRANTTVGYTAKEDGNTVVVELNGAPGNYLQQRGQAVLTFKNGTLESITTREDAAASGRDIVLDMEVNGAIAYLDGRRITSAGGSRRNLIDGVGTYVKDELAKLGVTTNSGNVSLFKDAAGQFYVQTTEGKIALIGNRNLVSEGMNAYAFTQARAGNFASLRAIYNQNGTLDAAFETRAREVIAEGLQRAYNNTHVVLGITGRVPSRNGLFQTPEVEMGCKESWVSMTSADFREAYKAGVFGNRAVLQMTAEIQDKDTWAGNTRELQAYFTDAGNGDSLKTLVGSSRVRLAQGSGKPTDDRVQNVYDIEHDFDSVQALRLQAGMRRND